MRRLRRMGRRATARISLPTHASGGDVAKNKKPARKPSKKAGKRKAGKKSSAKTGKKAAKKSPAKTAGKKKTRTLSEQKAAARVRHRALLAGDLDSLSTKDQVREAVNDAIDRAELGDTGGNAIECAGCGKPFDSSILDKCPNCWRPSPGLD